MSSIVALVASLPQPALVVGVSSTSILIAVSAAPAAVTPIVVVASDESAGAEVTVAVPADPSDSVPAIRVIHARGIVQSADSPPARAAEPAELRSGRADTTLAAMDFDASRDGETSLCNLDPTRLAARVGLVLAERAVEAAARIDAVLSPAPIVYGLLTNVVAVDLPSLELGVQRLIEEVEEIGDEVADTLTGVPVTTWLTVFAVSAAAIEGVRLIVRRSRGRPVLAVGPGGEPSSWPESVGRPPEDLP